MSKSTMKAVRLHAHGGPEVLRYEDVPIPEPAPGEVLVRVHAVGVNPPDRYLRDGLTSVPGSDATVTLPVVPGTDVSGVVEAVAADVDGLAVGDEVFGLLRFPGFGGSAYAEYVAAPAAHLARKPAGVDHVHAAGAPMAGLTAWQFLIEVGHDRPSPFQDAPHRPARLDAGTTVLVNGAAGGVGHIAVQLAKWQGARVVAVASGGHASFLRELGADRFVDYTEERAEDVVHDVDLVLDTVGGPGSRRFLRTLRRGGSLFPVLPGVFDEAEVDGLGVTVSSAQVRSDGGQLAELGRLLDAGTVRVAIDSTYALADARAAHERADRGHLRGKIVLTVA
ncbi:NADP-dependent oxidoreductase [Streptomyces longwoodensis]|uniref:NADP-dependent oxidoreductase n=1 Tax=Streptomyces longwoodensis TaxID=68231 RepID=UPI0038182F97